MIQKSKFVQGLGLMVVLTLLLGGVFSAYADGLPDTPDWTVQGGSAGDKFGYSVSTAGDVNGDGYDDVIVGAPVDDNGEYAGGAVFVWYGSSEGLYEGNGTPASADWTAESDQDGARFGHSVGAADVNGDGYDDVIVGAPEYTNGEEDYDENEGAVFVWHGSSSGLGDPGTPSNADWMAESNQADAQFGYAVGTAGDVNHNNSVHSYDDVIVGAPFYDNGQSDEGAAFVWHGSSSGLGSSGTPANADWTAEADQAGAEFGTSVGTAGDVNGDGCADVIVGAPRYDDDPGPDACHGRAYVYHGSSSGLSGTPDWSVIGGDGNYFLGQSVGTAGDVNDDDYDDVIIGEPQHGYGYAYIYHGDEEMDTTADWQASGESDGRFGHSAGTAGDVNHDGYDDVIIGATNTPTAGTGTVYVYYGDEHMDTTVDWQDDGSGCFGWSVSTAGDVDNDGYDDIIIGEPTYSSGRAHAYYYDEEE